MRRTVRCKLDAGFVWICDLLIWQDPFELMEILKKVLTFLDPKHDVDVRED